MADVGVGALGRKESWCRRLVGASAGMLGTGAKNEVGTDAEGLWPPGREGEENPVLVAHVSGTRNPVSRDRSQEPAGSERLPVVHQYDTGLIDT